MANRLLLSLLFFGFIAFQASSAEFFVLTQGLAYTPSAINAQVGDTVTFNVNFGFHPTVQVSKADWNANRANPLQNGFVKNSGSTFSLILADTNTIYYVCEAHIGSGMKGKIAVSAPTATRPALTQPLLFANPVTSELRLPTILGIGTARIVNSQGQEVLHHEVNASGTVPVSQLPSGSYLLLLNQRRIRFIKE